jgi:hypothetical protein
VSEEAESIKTGIIAHSGVVFKCCKTEKPSPFGIFKSEMTMEG